MFKKPSLTSRIATGKTLGLLVGLIAFFTLPTLMADAPERLRWAILLWYISLGAFIGVFGVFTWHPIFKFSLSWWWRGAFLGAWMNFVLTFFAYDNMHLLLLTVFGEESMLTSPYWFVLEGALFGLLVDYFATRFGGEGKETVEVPTKK